LQIVTVNKRTSIIDIAIVFISIVPMGRLFIQYIVGDKADKIYVCKQCRLHLAAYDDIISKAFQGQNGRAYLFDSAINVYTGPKMERVLMAGLHMVCDLYCIKCHSPLGWYYVDAFLKSHKNINW
jgi:hypothetical protein